MGELARLAVTERGEKRKTLRNIPSRVITPRAARRVELLRCAAKALWALAPCGIWDGLLVCVVIPRDLVGHFVLAALPKVGFDSQNTAPWCFARSR